MSEHPHQRPGLQVRRVFLSSTSVDLEPYRNRVASLVQTGFGQLPVTMNTFPLRPTGSEHTPDATAVSLDELRSSQIYILLLAWRYGHRNWWCGHEACGPPALGTFASLGVMRRGLSRHAV
jgi:Domain of unknown function (DUF4062)